MCVNFRPPLVPPLPVTTYPSLAIPWFVMVGSGSKAFNVHEVAARERFS